MIVGILSDFDGGDEVVFGVDCGLNVVANGGFAAFAQLAGVGVGEIDLAGGTVLAAGLIVG